MFTLPEKETNIARKIKFSIEFGGAAAPPPAPPSRTPMSVETPITMDAP